MKRKKLNHSILLMTPLIIMVFGQVMSKIGAIQSNFFNIFIFLGYFALIVRGILWIIVIRKFPLSFAYPIMSLSYVLVLIISYFFFDENLNVYKIIGSLLIMIGISINSFPLSSIVSEETK